MTFGIGDGGFVGMSAGFAFGSSAVVGGEGGGSFGFGSVAAGAVFGVGSIALGSSDAFGDEAFCSAAGGGSDRLSDGRVELKGNVLTRMCCRGIRHAGWSHEDKPSMFR